MNMELRIPTAQDRDGLKAVCNAVERKYLSDRLPDPYTAEDADWWINMIAENEGENGVWRVIYVDGKLVGVVSVEKQTDVYRRDGEIGYYLLTEYWSKGIMTAAAKEICRIAFEQLDIIRISGACFAPNVGSRRRVVTYR